MTKTLLFLTLMLVAPVAGAEEILFNNCMKLHANTENEPLCDRFRYQPAEEAKDYCRACKEELTFSSYCQDVGCYDKEPKKQPAEEAKPLIHKATFLMNCRYEDNALVEGNSEKCPKKYWDEEAKQLKYDPSRPILEIDKSDAEKCDNALKKYDDAKEGGFRVPDIMDDITAYCTRALLEEMRNK